MPKLPKEIIYSSRYQDDVYIYQHVILPKHVYKKMPKERLLTETEWTSLGIQKGVGWEHYLIHKPEPYVLLFRKLAELKTLLRNSSLFEGQEVICIS
jgi:cyclin-dependent kinase regulatory subunit CKS1